VTERQHGTLGNVLRIFKDDLKVKEILVKAENNLNLSFNAGINCSPIDLIKEKSPLNLNNIEPFIDITESLSYQRQQKEKSLIERNKKRNLTKRINIGDLIMIKNATRMNKLEEIWDGPFKIEDVKCDENLYKVSYENGISEWLNLKRLRKLEG
jgi:hypothetical protein